MSREKQIKSTDWLTRDVPKEQLEREKQEAVMSAYLQEYFAELSFDFDGIAEKMVAIGYRKQSEGEWRRPRPFLPAHCSQCLSEQTIRGVLQPYCLNCGAKMKGGAE